MAVESLKSLSAQIRDCRLCEADLPLGPRPVFQAARSARLLVAGQAPGTAVHASGVPFDDPSGERLREWMGVSPEVFYDPSQVAIVPMGFCYPGKGKSGDLPPRSECASAWRERLLATLVNVELTLVIGQYARMWYLPQTKKQSLTEVVRDWQKYAPAIFPMPHPSPRNNIWLRRNSWFEQEAVPALQRRVGELLRS